MPEQPMFWRVGQRVASLPLVGKLARTPYDLYAGNFDRVAPGVWVANYWGARFLPVWAFDRVFSVAADQELPSTTDSFDLVPDARVLDREAEFAAAVGTVRAAMRQGDRVLIHCSQGKERAPTVTATALAARLGISFDSALARIKRRRSLVDPTPPLRTVASAYLQEDSDA